MSNMLSNGVSGLSAAQIALNTVSNNIANAGTDGYSRQSVVQVEQIGQSNGRYTIGSGVDVVAVQRAYSEYLNGALWTSNTAMQGATTTDGLTTALNSLLKNSGDLQGSLDTFYSAFSTVASGPTTTSSRQALLGNAQALTTIFNTLGQQLSQQQVQISSQISNTATSINTVTAQIAALNSQISQASVGGNSPNDLLDQRDTLIKQLSGYTGISTVAEKDGTISIYTSGGGQALVSGSNSYTLTAGGSQYDPSRTVLLDAQGNDISSQFTGGSLGALISYRSNTLDVAQNQLGQTAIALASSVNAQQAQGLDLNGKLGGAIFGVAAPTVYGASNNQGSAGVSASISDVSKLTSSDYILKYTGSTTAPAAGGWSLTTSGGQAVALTDNGNGTFTSADGLTVSVDSGTPQQGDSYQIQPTRTAANTLSVAMTDPRGIAAAAAFTGTAATGNTGTAKVGSVAVDNGSSATLFNGGSITFTGASTYTLVDSSGTHTGLTYTAGQPITSADGWSVNLSGTPASGDSFTIAGNQNGLSDNSNALTLAGMADTGVINGGTTSIIDAYANLTTQIGTAGSQADANLTTQTALYNQALTAQQGVAGVNLNEEAASLVKYQQAYQASAQVISTAQTIFASLLSAVQG